MDTAFHLARLLLAAVFALAGVAKLADRRGTRRAVVDFGIPGTLAPALAAALPLAEFATAAALLIPRWARWGAGGALALLGLFAAGIGANLLQGRQPNCHCFGQLASQPVGRSTLARNGALLSVAVFVAWRGPQPGETALGPLADLGLMGLLGVAAMIALLLVVALEGWTVANLLRQQGRILLRLEVLEARLPASPGLAVGSLAPDFSSRSLDGATVTLADLLASGNPVVLIFSDPDCVPCQDLMPDVADWQREHAGALSVVLVSPDPPDNPPEAPAGHAGQNVLLERDGEVAAAYGVSVKPTAVIVLPDGRIGSQLLTGADPIRAAVAEVVGSDARGGGAVPAEAAPPAAKRGDPAPALRLPDLAGQPVDLRDFRGTDTIVLFWNPVCPFCSTMLPDVKAWEARRSADDPGLVVVSSGSVEANRAMGLQSTVLLDSGFRAGRAFGASGTPAAVLVDARGVVASDTAVGVPEVATLLQRRQRRHA